MEEHYKKILSDHQSLEKRRVAAASKLKELRKRFEKDSKLYTEKSLCVYCAGSLGRGEVGVYSDLDLFVLGNSTTKKWSRLAKLEILANVVEINRELGYGSFSNDGQFLKLYDLDQMLGTLGSPQDDIENLFTARLLLLLESQPVCNDDLFQDAIQKIVTHYFRDKRGKQSFRPLFLLNDILRYWRTLCLNYELIRDDPDKPWRKKNINLKFSRMLTVFGTVLPLIAEPMSDNHKVRRLTSMSPHERFAFGMDMLEDHSMGEEYGRFLDDYEAFLGWKEQMGSRGELPDALDDESRLTAKRFSDFIYSALGHSRVEPELRKYLIL